MAPKRKKNCQRASCSTSSPAVKTAKKLKAKYMSPRKPGPDKKSRTRRALYQVMVNKVSVRKASEEFDLSYSYLQRRVSGETSVDARNGPRSVFNSKEERELAEYLSEMAKRGMGLRPGEFLDFVQEIIKKDKRKTPFTNDRPSYNWYKAFMDRNSDIVGKRKEVLLESCRGKLSGQRLDNWYSSFRDFLIEKDLLDKPECIWNADETGFQMGSKAGYVIGPSRKNFPKQVPHMAGTSTKSRLTVMFSASAIGSIMPPFYVYPEPAPKGVNPLNCSLPGGHVEYTEKGWMDGKTFEKYINHFDKHIVTQRPVVLLIDSVGSHINKDIFTLARSKGIELYRIVPNATHLMQPLDKGVFGPLKSKWYQIVRKHNRENPGVVINKTNFAEKLKDTYNEFYKPSIVVNSFASSGIYPVNRNVISDEQLKTSLTFEHELTPPSSEQVKKPEMVDTENINEQVFNAYTSVLTTPMKQKYADREREGYNLQGISPGYDTYVLLKSRVKDGKNPEEREEQCQNSTYTENTALNLLADVAIDLIQKPETTSDKVNENLLRLGEHESTTDEPVSPVLRESLFLPKVTTSKPKRKSTLDDLPDNLTSPECIRKLSVKSLDKVRKMAVREKKAKASYLSKLKGKAAVKSSKGKSAANPSKGKSAANPSKGKSAANSSKGKSAANSSKGKRLVRNVRDEDMECYVNTEDDGVCVVCDMTWKEDQSLMLGHTWIHCDECNAWVHEDCLPIGFTYDKTQEEFVCHKCKTDI